MGIRFKDWAKVTLNDGQVFDLVFFRCSEVAKKALSDLEINKDKIKDKKDLKLFLKKYRDDGQAIWIKEAYLGNGIWENDKVWCWHEGFDCAKENNQVEKNPYTKNTWHWDQWMEGFNYFNQQQLQGS